MNFGKWIVVAFVLFTAFIATLVTVCVRQDIPLVTKEYYKEELAYGELMEKISRANSLTVKPEIVLNDHNLRITYNSFSEITHGEVVLFRPSDPSLDQRFKLNPGTNEFQDFELKQAVPGLYKARLSWEQKGQEYFIEKIIVL